MPYLTLMILVKYIALLAMVKIVPSHPHLISEYQDEILESLDDQDMSIRMRALELTSNMVSRHLSVHRLTPAYLFRRQGQPEEHPRDCQSASKGPGAHDHHRRDFTLGSRFPGENSSIRNDRAWSHCGIRIA
jgi:hypothetical protein